jgi:hypothetical protein
MPRRSAPQQALLLHRQNPPPSRTRLWPKTNIYRGRISGPRRHAKNALHYAACGVAGTPTRHFYGVLERRSKSCRSWCGNLRCDPRSTSTPRQSPRLSTLRRPLCCPCSSRQTALQGLIRGARKDPAIRQLSRRFKAMDLRVQKGRQFVSHLHPRMQGETLRILLISYWRPRRDLNPCYRRENEVTH